MGPAAVYSPACKKRVHGAASHSCLGEGGREGGPLITHKLVYLGIRVVFSLVITQCPLQRMLPPIPGGGAEINILPLCLRLPSFLDPMVHLAFRAEMGMQGPEDIHLVPRALRTN